MYAKVEVKNSKTPLIVLIRHTLGKLLTHVSRTLLEPMENLCDAKFRGDRIMVTDTDLRFKCTVV